MSQYTLHYFDSSHSRGEDCRLALAAAGVPFEDHRVPTAEWPALKSKMPYGSMPVLESNGKAPLAQSNAILTYIGRAHDLHPKDAWEAAQHEAILESVEEVRALLAPTGKMKDEAEKRAAREALASGPLQLWGGRIEKQIRGPFLAGEKLCVADIKVFQIVNAFKANTFDHIPPTVFQDFPKLNALHQAVAAHPKIAGWRAAHTK
ncbi:MAG TPA: glutathione S-transferase family protein [Polyangiaceae bacterium]|nr:glutathione S-transferase family protein [Polyangiaceae bacterium]